MEAAAAPTTTTTAVTASTKEAIAEAACYSLVGSSIPLGLRSTILHTFHKSNFHRVLHYEVIILSLGLKVNKSWLKKANKGCLL